MTMICYTVLEYQNKESSMTPERIRAHLVELRDEKYKAFQSKLIPTINADTILGVRTPVLRKYAKELIKQREEKVFLTDLPHGYYDENILHGCLISLEKDFDSALALVEEFLPYIDNWAVCDLLSPKVLKEKPGELLACIRKWMRSDHVYAVRFGIRMLMVFYLDERFDTEYPAWVASVQSEEYYVRMMAAWYFATALAKQYDAVLPFLTQRRLDSWTHNKTIQKATESYRITAEQKAYLRTLKIK